MSNSVLNVSDLTVTLDSHSAAGAGHSLIADVNFDVRAGELLCVVGESGSGKSVTGHAILGLAREAGLTVGGVVEFEGTNLVDLDPKEVRALRGRGIAMIPQEPSSALDPLFTIGMQVAEAVERAEGGSAKSVRSRVLELLETVHIPEPEYRMKQYPHELSGGLCQRVLIAVALAGRPRLIIADEPTSALDATVQLEVLELIDQVRRDSGTATVLITHDISVAARADRIVVMYAGTVVEHGTASEILQRPKHPYTAALIESIPDLDPVRYRQPEFRLSALSGGVPSPGQRGTGCVFMPRCALAGPGCELPQVLRHVDPDHASACWRSTSDSAQEAVMAQ